ncbi:MAG TPA: PorP/SprF family type IX secretion system membrane protein [Flavobacteriales bacterium]|nr:PorP/SprF family type IX secretion system membrane protein [Flavobacteriales bacterium]HRE97098.1 PorP/SprF family type IX secretion system membrane protein [Flavobacteriales bacterium]HRJ38332.1 PorP/SprF family type IX secretion system membrane protein [Flavobacteriales bacterium]
MFPKAHILFFLLVLPFTNGKAQDIHFSQFDLSPINLNPGNTGLFDGTYRFAGNFRNQWRSVTVPYSTFSLSADANNFLEKKGLGAGIRINHDIAGDSRFRTFQFDLAGSYGFHPGGDSTLRISVGAVTGITSRNLSYSALYFDNQYNGIAYDASLGNGENFQRESRAYLNLQLGTAFYKKLGKRNFISGGISLGNITKPKQSYFDVTTIKLDRRFNVHATFNYAINDEIEIVPSVLAQFQGTYQEILIGSQVRYILVNEKGVYRAVRAGLFYRAKDAGYLSVGIDYDDWVAGISYDINISDLNPASRYRGGIEFAVIRILNVYKPKMIQRRICPNYI